MNALVEESSGGGQYMEHGKVSSFYMLLSTLLNMGLPMTAMGTLAAKFCLEPLHMELWQEWQMLKLCFQLTLTPSGVHLQEWDPQHHSLYFSTWKTSFPMFLLSLVLLIMQFKIQCYTSSWLTSFYLSWLLRLYFSIPISGIWLERKEG